MKTKAILIILFLIVVTSCKNGTKIEENSKIKNLDLRLNNGQKWIANFETHEGIKIIDSIISTFDLVTNKDYNTLGNKLSKQTSYIIKNCSMKGEPHDQLHVVLVPMLDEISNLKESINISDSKNAKTSLHNLINKYFEYFKL